jgi:2-phospho-L-lactate guanylyltransferase (CobY/MobA/RfbA family)
MVEEAGLLPIVVAGDETVAEWSISAGIRTIPDPGDGLSSAAAVGIAAAMDIASPWVVLHVDLPLLVASELQPVLAASTMARDMIAPSSDGGTTLVGSSRPFRFSYGAGSFFRHLPRLEEPDVIFKLGLAHDLDSVNDLESVLGHPLGAWLREHVG